MIRVIVIDDEPPILRTVCDKIEATNPHFRVEATANNGKEALSYLEKRKVDVLFVDVSMPVMNGLELLEKINERKISVIPVILSGYKEFEYVRQAYASHAIDYLLKPLDENELKLLLNRIESEFQKKQFEEKAQNFELALSGKHNTDIKSTEGWCLILFTVGNSQIYFAGNEWNYAEMFHTIDLEKEIGKLVDPMSFWVVDGRSINEKLVFIKKGREPKFKDVNSILENIQVEGIPLTGVYCKTGISMSDIYTVYCGMEKYTWDNMFFLKSALFAFDMNHMKIERLNYDMHSNTERLVKECVGANPEDIFAAFARMIESFSIHPVSYKEAVKQIRYFFSRLCKESSVNCDYIEIEEDIQYILGNCYTAETILEEFHFLIDEKFGRAVRGEKDKETLAREVKFFLDENYKRRISNQDLTEEFGFVSSYISSIFKTYYGKTPMDYVVECRMEEGKRLLRRGDMKIKAIADRLGYEDSLYFSKVFKKIEGMSPKQYMNKRDL